MSNRPKIKGLKNKAQIFRDISWLPTIAEELATMAKATAWGICKKGHHAEQGARWLFIQPAERGTLGMDLQQDEAMELELLLRNYRDNVRRIWNIRSKCIYSLWKDERGDFHSIKERLNIINPFELLDIGYGYGRISSLYAEIPFVVGMDISTIMLNIASQNSMHNPNINMVLGDIRHVPFENSSFSCIISIRTLNHIHPDDFHLAEHEINRVCRHAVILLESDIKVPGADYEFEHDYDRFLFDNFSQTKKQLQENVYLRTYLRRKA